mgnify:CR=1 FL=1
MKNNKNLFFITVLILLNGCAQSTAFLGPALTVATTGNVYQAGFQYGTNEAIKKETGKDTINYVGDLVETNKKEKKFNKDFIILVENRIKKTRMELLKPRNQ